MSSAAIAGALAAGALAAGRLAPGVTGPGTVAAAGGLGAVAYGDAVWIGLGSALGVGLLQVLTAARRRPTGRPPLGPWSTLVYLAVLACVAVLATTAFAALLQGVVLRGWLLLVHSLVGGAATVAFALLALTWGHSGRLVSGTRFGWLGRSFLWLLLAAAFLSAGSMLAASMPWFGTERMEDLIAIHRWSGLAVTMAVILHGSVVLGERLRRRGAQAGLADGASAG